MAALEALGDEKRRAHNTKAWTGNPGGAAGLKQFGCATGDIRTLAKKIKTDHGLALELWKTGNIDAQLLAILLMKPGSLSAAEVDKMVRAARFAWVADWFNAYIVKEQPPAEKEALRTKWMEDDDGWVARAGWNLTASRIAHAAKGAQVAKRAKATNGANAGTAGATDELDLPALLNRIEAEMVAAPPETQWTMNAVLANIGIHHAKLRRRAIAIGEKLGVYRDYPCSKGCTSPFAPIWINEMVKRQG